MLPCSMRLKVGGGALLVSSRTLATFSAKKRQKESTSSMELGDTLLRPSSVSTDFDNLRGS